jgi:hypothetical protein
VGRKLPSIEPHTKSKIRLVIRLVSAGDWNDQVQRKSNEGYTVWSLGHANIVKPIRCMTIKEAVNLSLVPDL